MEKTVSLYEMVTDLVELVEVEEIEGTQKEEIMSVLKDTMENKAENIIAVIRNFETRIEGVKAEEKRLAEYRKAEEKKLERLKQYTINCMEIMGNKKLETNLGRISLAKKPSSLIIRDENNIPDIYKTVEQIVKVDKNQIKKDLKEKDIDGVELVEGGYRLAIK